MEQLPKAAGRFSDPLFTSSQPNEKYLLRSILFLIMREDQPRIELCNIA